MGSERAQASVEWIGLLLLVSLALAAGLAFVPAVDGRPLGAALVRALVCAVRGDCGAEHAELARAYGQDDARLVRRHAPNIVYEPGTLSLPVDYRRCRSHRCSDAPADRDLDVHRAKRGGAPATTFTRIARKDGRTYLQYWLYYPDSASTFLGSHAVHKLIGIEDAGFHPDDWESYQVRIDPDGRVWARASSHKEYKWCKQIMCSNRWGPETGWTRVSRGSHAGHIPLERTLELKDFGVQVVDTPVSPGNGLRERSTMAPGLSLVPLETLAKDTYKPLKGGIDPPWTKRVYRDPESDSTK
jgi:hypothetical protein